jgi:hypothetical protein
VLYTNGKKHNIWPGLSRPQVDDEQGFRRPPPQVHFEKASWPEKSEQGAGHEKNVDYHRHPLANVGF